MESWDQNLSLMSKTLKEWMDCQRDWLYLESIFQSSEIQKHLEQEHAMFKKVDKTFRGECEWFRNCSLTGSSVRGMGSTLAGSVVTSPALCRDHETYL